MALLTSLHLSLKNGLVPLSDKLNEDNFSTWKKSVLLTVRTLKLQDHFCADKIHPQFEAIANLEAESEIVNKNGDPESESIVKTKKNPSSTPTILQELEKFGEWVQRIAP
ncbi:hypothetical protein PIB30_071787 [Stylosanthes scabra]|uniref:Retrotransposon Copia-like N-terminal domain-containing protein n=1 Tax=Stylosanthes scabra TaxID=79078 RepID=A0ABU6TR84_9FABA|nr:hypothetical protein [Stylosanthes scabra]